MSKKQPFDLVKFLRRPAYYLIGIAGGLWMAVEDAGGVAEINWELGALFAIGFGAAHATLGLYKKWGLEIPRAGMIRRFLSRIICVAIVSALALSLPGCALLGGPGSGSWVRPAAGDHSKTEVSFIERTADGTETEISFAATGESAMTAALHYTGPQTENVTNPWDLRIDGQGNVTSPQAMPVAEGYGKLLSETPGTISELAANIGQLYAGPLSGSGGNGETQSASEDFRRALIGELIRRFIGAKASGGASASQIIDRISPE